MEKAINQDQLIEKGLKRTLMLLISATMKIVEGYAANAKKFYRTTGTTQLANHVQKRSIMITPRTTWTTNLLKKGSYESLRTDDIGLATDI